ncbi:MAG: DinB family protein [Flavobacteriales bacterium]
MEKFDLIQDVREIILRDLQDLETEVNDTSDHNLWRSVPGITNSVGTLAFHLCGNLRHFIGAVLGKDGYLRMREEEFSRKDLTKEELIREISSTRQAVERALSSLSETQLTEEMPDTPPQHKGRTVGFFLLHWVCHLTTHRGQLNYLRRILG